MTDEPSQGTAGVSAAAPVLEMRVKSGTDPQALASAISHALYRGQEVVVRAIGERAFYQAQKAFVIAVRFTALRGINLVVSPGWLDGSREPGDLRSEMSFRVFHFAQGPAAGWTCRRQDVEASTGTSTGTTGAAVIPRETT